MAVVGIDLGTTNSLVAALIDGQVQLIPNEFGDCMTPSVVYLSESGFVVGKVAKEHLVTDPDKTVQLFKREMGTNRTYQLGGRGYSASDLSAVVVKQLIADAERFLAEKVDEVIISVPAYFNEEQRRATKRIGDILGVTVERLINEPSAAAIACHEPETFETFIVFDFGGGTLDVSVVDCFENVISICSISGDNYLGGSDFDQALVAYFCQQHDLSFDSLDNQTKSSLLLSAERCRLKLQTEETAQMMALLNDELVGLSISKTMFKVIAQPILDKIKKVISRAVRDSGFQAGDFDSFVLVGGASKMPLVQEFLISMLNLPIKVLEDSDELVAKGLGTYIGIKTRQAEMSDLVVTDVCPFSLGISIFDQENNKDKMSRLIEKNTVLPASYSSIFETTNKGQDKITLKVYQGEAMLPEMNILLGERSVAVPVNVKESERIRVTFSYDLNAMLYIEVMILSTGKCHLYKIGENRQLVPVKASEILEHIKDLSMALTYEPEYQILQQRLNRLATEVPSQYQESLYQTMLRFEEAYTKTHNNLQQKKAVIQEFSKIVAQVEAYIDGNNLDIFRDLGDLGDD